MTESDLNIITVCRAAIDEYYARDTTNDPAIVPIAEGIAKKTMQTLSSYGFNSFAEYDKFDREKCFEAYKECRPISGSCDFCGEEVLKDQPCVKKYGALACAQSIPTTPTNDIYRVAKAHWESGMNKIIESAGTVRSHAVCPEGHGFYLDLKNCKDFPFSMTWKTFR